MAGNRRWYQFQLGTLMIVVTILATFLGYHVNWIRQRHKFLVEVDRSADGRYFPLARSRPTQAPGLLWLFGERPCDCVTVSINDTANEGLNGDSQHLLKRAKRLFPEAALSTMYVSPQGKARVEPAEKLGY